MLRMKSANKKAVEAENDNWVVLEGSCLLKTQETKHCSTL